MSSPLLEVTGVSKRYGGVPVVFASSAAVVILIHRRDLLASARPWVAAALAFLLFLPNLLWNARHDFQTVRHTAENRLKLNCPSVSGGVRHVLDTAALQRHLRHANGTRTKAN